MSKTAIPELLKIEEVAAKAKRSVSTIRLHIRDGRLTPLDRQSDNEPLRFTEEEVLRYLGLSEQKHEANASAEERKSA